MKGGRAMEIKKILQLNRPGARRFGFCWCCDERGRLDFQHFEMGGVCSRCAADLIAIDGIEKKGADKVLKGGKRK